MASFHRDAFESDAVALLPSLDAEIDSLTEAVGNLSGAGVRTQRRSVHAVRNLLEVPLVRTWVREPAVRSIVERILGPTAVAIRGILFDKNPTANWKVPWHQDLSIAVSHRAELSGYGPWSVKAGVTHVQPPVEVLEQMCTIRLHLDACGPENGPLKVIPGSHRDGILNESEIAGRIQRGPILICEVPRGGAVLMRPLILHASSAADVPAHRRVIHIEFCGAELPPGLRWANAF